MNLYIAGVVGFDKLYLRAEATGLANPRAGLDAIGLGLVAGGNTACGVNTQ